MSVSAGLRRAQQLMTIAARITVLIVFSACVLMPSVVSAASAKPAWVIPETLNVRSGPGTDRKKIGTLTRGAKVHVLSFANNWCWSSLPDGSKGWIAEWHLQFSYDKGRELAEEAKSSEKKSGGTTSTPAWVKGDSVNVRSGPGLGYDRYGTITQGTKVYVTERKSGWCKVSTGNGYGWMLGELLEYDIEAGRKLASAVPSTPKQSEPQHTAKGFVAGSAVNLRKGPGTSYDKVATVVEGQTLYITETKGDWYKATVHGGNSGWIARWLVKGAEEVPTATNTPKATSTSGRFETLTAWITEEVVNVRTKPSTDGDVDFQLERGAKVTVTELDGHWGKVKTSSGKTGWVAGWVFSCLPPGEEPTAKEGDQTVVVNVGWVARPKVNLRAGPSLDSDRIGYATLSTRVLIVGQKGDWYKVAMDNGEIGWMASNLIDTRAQRLARRGGSEASSSEGGSTSGAGTAMGLDFPSPTTRQADCSVGEQIIAKAKQFVGASYVRGSASPSRGFDCSGFVHYIHKAVLGVSLPRSSDTQFRRGQPVSRSDLAPGDVVFFENTYKHGISHVGLYIGNNQFIHAANSRRGVRIDSLDSSYYAPRYAGARRMY